MTFPAPGCAQPGIRVRSGKPSDKFAAVYADAQAKFSVGDLRAAFSITERADQASAASDPLWHYRFQTLEAEILLWQGRSLDADKLTGQKPPRGCPLKFIIQRKLVQGRTSYLLKRYREAAVEIAEVEAYARRSSRGMLPDVLLAKGTLLLVQGKVREAETLLLQTAKLARRSRDQVVEAKVLGTLSKLYTSKMKFSEAIDRGTEGLAISKTLQAHHIETGLLLNLGWSNVELGDLDMAVVYLEKGVDQAEAADMKFVLESTLNNLGRVELIRGNFRAAKARFGQALKIAEDRGSGAQEVTTYLDNIASVDILLNQLDQAEQYNTKSARLFHEIHDRDGEFRAKVNAASIAISRAHFDQAKTLLMETIQNADTPTSTLWEAHSELARMYVATGRSDQASRQFEETIETLSEARSRIGDLEHRLAFSFNVDRFLADYLRFLASRNETWKALQVAESMRARSLEEGLGGATKQMGQLQISDVQDFLQKRNLMVLAYWLSPQRSYMWSITSSQVSLIELPARQVIEAKIKLYRDAITRLDDVLTPTNKNSEDLYHMLVEPAIRLKPAGAKVEIVPYGNLGKLNFETLLVPGHPAHFLIEDIEMEIASSIRLLIRNKPALATSKSLLLIGDPIKATNEYPSLVYARKEMKEISKLFPVSKIKVYSGKNATPSAYFSSDPSQYEVIDFVTHGYASVIRPLDSAIILSLESSPASPTGKRFRLLARDILRKPIHARMVVISACYGAGTRSYSSEGLVGLAWAFLRAGAHQVIAGLWDVDDEVTPELMKNFYSEWLKSKVPSQALRSAKLKMIRSHTGDHRPYYWGSLQLYTGS